MRHSMKYRGGYFNAYVVILCNNLQWPAYAKLCALSFPDESCSNSQIPRDESLVNLGGKSEPAT